MVERSIQQELEMHRPAATAAYTPEFVAALANDTKIDRPDKVEQLRDFLISAALVYLYQKAEQDNRTDVQIEKLRIKRIAKLADTLNAEIASLSEWGSELLWSGQLQLEANLFKIPADVEKSEFGHLLFHQQFENGAVSKRILRQPQIRESIGIIGSLALHALKHAEPQDGGRPSDQALHNWVGNVKGFVTSALGWKFTYYAVEGVPASRVFLFCQTAMHALDPSVEDKALKTSIRNVIAFKQQREKNRLLLLKKRKNPRPSN